MAPWAVSTISRAVSSACRHSLEVRAGAEDNRSHLEDSHGERIIRIELAEGSRQLARRRAVDACGLPAVDRERPRRYSVSLVHCHANLPVVEGMISNLESPPG